MSRRQEQIRRKLVLTSLTGLPGAATQEWHFGSMEFQAASGKDSRL